MCRVRRGMPCTLGASAGVRRAARLFQSPAAHFNHQRFSVQRMHTLRNSGPPQVLQTVCRKVRFASPFAYWARTRLETFSHNSLFSKHFLKCLLHQRKLTRSERDDLFFYGLVGCAAKLKQLQKICHAVFVRELLAIAHDVAGAPVMLGRVLACSDFDALSCLSGELRLLPKCCGTGTYSAQRWLEVIQRLDFANENAIQVGDLANLLRF